MPRELNKLFDLDYQRQRLFEETAVLNDDQRRQVRRALELAEMAHQGQERDGGFPYVLHPLRASLILLSELKFPDAEMVCAVLCHDVLEESAVTAEDLRKHFGQEVARLVKAVTRQRPPRQTLAEKIRDKKKKIDEIAASDRRVRLVKLCDQLDNRRMQEFISPEAPEYQKIPRWNREFTWYLPMAQKTDAKLYQLYQDLVQE